MATIRYLFTLTLIIAYFIALGQNARTHSTSCISGQDTSATKRPTIPLEISIPLTITNIDTSELDCYNVYYFNYESKKARFIIEKAIDRPTIKSMGTFILCRNIEFCTIDKLSGKRINFRGCHIINGYGIARLVNAPQNKIKYETVMEPFYDFNEYSDFPTLRLCDPK